MRRADVDLLDLRRTYWVPTVTAPCADWAAAPGCCPGARFVSTQNAEDNAHMVAINELLGFRPVEVSAEFVKRF